MNTEKFSIHFDEIHLLCHECYDSIRHTEWYNFKVSVRKKNTENYIKTCIPAPMKGDKVKLDGIF